MCIQHLCGYSTTAPPFILLFCTDPSVHTCIQYICGYSTYTTAVPFIVLFFADPSVHTCIQYLCGYSTYTTVPPFIVLFCAGPFVHMCIQYLCGDVSPDLVAQTTAHGERINSFIKAHLDRIVCRASDSAMLRKISYGKTNFFSNILLNCGCLSHISADPCPILVLAGRHVDRTFQG